MPNIAYFCAMVLRTHCTGHCSGLYGKYGIPVRGVGCILLSVADPSKGQIRTARGQQVRKCAFSSIQLVEKHFGTRHAKPLAYPKIVKSSIFGTC